MSAIEDIGYLRSITTATLPSISVYRLHQIADRLQKCQSALIAVEDDAERAASGSCEHPHETWVLISEAQL